MTRRGVEGATETRSGVACAVCLSVVAAACALVAMAMCALFAPAVANADGGESFAVRIGYFGGPYYEKAVYSPEDLERLVEDVNGGELYEYSSMDKGGFLRKGFARGVPLGELLDNAGIDGSAVASFYFDTADGYKVEDEANPVRQWSYDELLGARRYYYSNIWQYYDFDLLELPDKFKRTVEDGRRVVPTVVALESSFERVGNGGEAVWNDSSLVSSKPGIRLMFGQKGATDSTAGFSAHSIQGLKVTFAGHPTIRVSQATLSGEVGDVVEVSYSLDAADEVLAQQGAGAISWSVADEQVARIVGQDGSSLRVEIVGEGETSLSALFGDADFEGATSVTVGVAGNAAAVGDDEPGEDSGDEEEDEDEDKDKDDAEPSGSGAGEGGGSGSGSGAGSGDASGTTGGAGTTDAAGAGRDAGAGRTTLGGDVTQLSVADDIDAPEDDSGAGAGGGGSADDGVAAHPARMVEIDPAEPPQAAASVVLQEDTGNSALVAGGLAALLLAAGALVHAVRYRRALGTPAHASAARGAAG